jgi:hypothetical protein
VSEETTLTLSEIRTAIEEFRPPDRPMEHRGAYFAEEGRRALCDELLEFFSEDD